MQIQRELYELIHKGLHPQRLTLENAELAFAEKWEEANVRARGINSGLSTLEHILHPEDPNEEWVISQRDATVAACVVQWLGTSCGLSFLKQAERLAHKYNLAQREANRNEWDERQKTWDEQAAERHKIQEEINRKAAEQRQQEEALAILQQMHEEHYGSYKFMDI